jgi:glycosyltransferase involved in cell wall biosynthesis
MGYTIAEEFVRRTKPDAAHIIGDPATVASWMLMDELKSIPVVAYMPVEGIPFNLRWEKIWKEAPLLTFISCSEFGAKALNDIGIDAYFAYHGVSSDFYPYEQDYRDEIRRSVGWDDKFIVMNVAANVGRKAWPRLFEAIGLLKKRHPDIYLYAHTVPFNNFWLAGWDLPQLANQIGVDDRVIFPIEMDRHNASVPLVGKDRPGLVDYYNMADCFVLPSKVEGFGLPLAEAMACGLPVAHTDYSAGTEVIGNAGIKIPVHDWEYSHSHNRQANLSPRDIAAAIEKMKNPEVNRQMRKKSIERAKTFTWDAYKVTLLELFHAIEEKNHLGQG